MKTTIIILLGMSVALGRAAGGTVGLEVNFIPKRSTPYDHQMARIVGVLEGKGGGGSKITVDAVNGMMEGLFAIPYRYSRTWVTPEHMRTCATADCKGKAIALYAQMKEAGTRDMYLVIGTRDWNSTTTHTWVEWKKAGVVYILDPTFYAQALRRSDIGAWQYRPQFAYLGKAKYQLAMN